MQGQGFGSTKETLTKDVSKLAFGILLKRIAITVILTLKMA